MKPDILNSLLLELKEVSGLDNLALDYNSVYRGYLLVKVNPNTSICGAFGWDGFEDKLTKKEMAIKLQSLIRGIEFGKNIIKSQENGTL